MKILFFTDNFPPEVNAAASRVYERAKYWVKWGHKVTVITSQPNNPEGKIYAGYQNAWCQKEDMDGIRVVRVKTFMSANEGTVLRILDFLSFMVTSFFAGLCQKKNDVIVSTSPQFFTAVSAWLVSKLKRTPYVFELGDLWPASITGVGVFKKGFVMHLLEKLELLLYRQSRRIVVLTTAFKNDLVGRGIFPDKIKVVINGAELSQYKRQEKDAALLKDLGLENKLVVGYIGTHGMSHGLSEVIEAAQQLRHEAEIVFLFVGAGAERQAIMQLAQQYQLKNVCFVERQPKTRMPAYWSLCDLALISLRNLPVFTTVIPSKMFEAMAMGIPLLMYGPRGEAQEILNEEQSGFFVESGHPNHLASRLKALSQDKLLIARARENAIHASKQHSREHQAELMVSALEEAIDAS